MRAGVRAVAVAMSRPAQCLDDIVETVDYLFIDIPDLIDADSEDPVPEPEVIEDKPAYAFNTPAGLQAHHARQQRPAPTTTYWQQLQQGSSAQPSSGLAGLTPSLGSLGASLLEAASASRLSQQQHQQSSCSLHMGLPQQTQITPQPEQSVQQQQQRDLWRQQGTSDHFTSSQSRTAPPVGPTPIDDQDMDES